MVMLEKQYNVAVS